MPGYDCSIKTEANKKKADHRFLTALKSSPKTENLVALPLLHKYSGITPIKEEGHSMAIDEVDGDVEGSTRRPQEHLVDDLACTALDFLGNQILKDSNSSMSRSFVKPDIEVQREMKDDDGSKVLLTAQPSPDITDHTVISFHQTSETSQMNVTNSSKKRHKVDAEESEDNEHSKGRTTKDVESKSFDSQKEEFPKGKRKARKRRRLALQRRGIKDVQRRSREDFCDNDPGPFSNSSEDSMFSEDEIQGGRASPTGSEASANSDEIWGPCSFIQAKQLMF